MLLCCKFSQCIFSVTIEYCGGGGNIVGPQRLHSWSKVFRFWQASPARLASKFKADACGGGYGPTMLPSRPRYLIVTENMHCETLQQSDIYMADTIRKNIAPK